MIEDGQTLLQHATDIVAAHVSNNDVAFAYLPDLIRNTYAALAALGVPAPLPEEPEHKPAVSARKSLANPNQILSMIDGKPYRTLRRHLSKHGMTPEDYRQRYKLAADYPMTAKAYSEQRSAMSRALGLGRKKAAPAEMTNAPVADEPVPGKRRGRPPKAADSIAGEAASPKPRTRKLSGVEALAQVRGESPAATASEDNRPERKSGRLSARFGEEPAAG